MSAKTIQQLRLLFTEREKTLKALALFGTTAENGDFVSKEVFQTVASANRSIIKQLKQTLKQLEKKMLDIIDADEKLRQQYKLITSIPGIGMQTAIYIIIATKGFDTFDISATLNDRGGN
jgi:hypothetical protein